MTVCGVPYARGTVRRTIRGTKTLAPLWDGIDPASEGRSVRCTEAGPTIVQPFVRSVAHGPVRQPQTHYPRPGPRRRPPRRRQRGTRRRPLCHHTPGPQLPRAPLRRRTDSWRPQRLPPDAMVTLPLAARRPYHDVMHASPDIVPVSRFREDVAGSSRRATADGKPVFITQGGRLTAVLLSRRRYDQLFELLAEIEGDPDRESRSRRLPARTDWPVHGFHPTRPRTHVDTLFGLVDPPQRRSSPTKVSGPRIRAALRLPIPGSTAMSRPMPSPTGVPDPDEEDFR